MVAENKIILLSLLAKRNNELQNDVIILKQKIKEALPKFNDEFVGDEWIRRSYKFILGRLDDISDSLKSNDWLLNGDRTPHPIKLAAMREYNPSVHNASSSVAQWRIDLDKPAGIVLQTSDLKEVFDIYFRHDLYGRFRHDDTIFFNRGISDPWYFTPPAGVSIALDVANRQNWFGYSDPLGHISTRESVVNLEQHRRKQPELTINNIAITQGATHTLTSILLLLKEQERRKKFLVPVPNYPPLVEQVGNHFNVERIHLSNEYRWNLSDLVKKLDEPDIAGILLNVPYNPTTDGSVYEDLEEIAEICLRADQYLLIVENTFVSKVGGKLDPIRFPNVIIIHSWSKTYGVAGLSIGHIVAHSSIIDQFYRFASSAYGSPPSFLYLVSTTLADLELGYHLDSERSLEKELIETISSPSLLFEEFKLWKEAEDLCKLFSDLICDVITTARWFDSINEVQSDPVAASDNRIIHTRLNGSTYDTFLSILAGKNVAVFPIDCLTPTNDYRHHLRVTTALHPKQLIHGMTAIGEELDNIYALQTRSEWLHNDDYIWLEQVGRFNSEARLNFWGHVRRVRLRFAKIAQMLGINIPDYALRAATLHDIGKVWSLFDLHKAKIEWTENFGKFVKSSLVPFEKGEIAIAKYILSIAHVLPFPSLPPELVNLLGDVFNIRNNNSGTDHLSYLLDIADKTSDFRLEEPVTLEGIEQCLHLKCLQVKLRYPENIIDIEKEFEQTGENLRNIHKKVELMF